MKRIALVLAIFLMSSTSYSITVESLENSCEASHYYPYFAIDQKSVKIKPLEVSSEELKLLKNYTIFYREWDKASLKYYDCKFSLTRLQDPKKIVAASDAWKKAVKDSVVAKNDYAQRYLDGVNGDPRLHHMTTQHVPNSVLLSAMKYSKCTDKNTTFCDGAKPELIDGRFFLNEAEHKRLRDYSRLCEGISSSKICANEHNAVSKMIAPHAVFASIMDQESRRYTVKDYAEANKKCEEIGKKRDEIGQKLSKALEGTRSFATNKLKVLPEHQAVNDLAEVAKDVIEGRVYTMDYKPSAEQITQMKVKKAELDKVHLKSSRLFWERSLIEKKLADINVKLAELKKSDDPLAEALLVEQLDLKNKFISKRTAIDNRIGPLEEANQDGNPVAIEDTLSAINNKKTSHILVVDSDKTIKAASGVYPRHTQSCHRETDYYEDEDAEDDSYCSTHLSCSQSIRRSAGSQRPNANN